MSQVQPEPQGSSRAGTTVGTVGPDGIAVSIAESPAAHGNGAFALLLGIALAALTVLALAHESTTVLGLLGALATVLVLSSLTIVQPGRTKVVQLFGRYVGTVRSSGLLWVLPLTTRKTLSVRVRNFETTHLKVNDLTGNPVEIAAIVVWQVSDTAKASFAVEEYVEFVAVQAEAAVRHVAGAYAYDGRDDEQTLRGSTDQVSAELAHEVAARVAVAGVEIVEVRVSHLAYAPEIAQAMLQRQQANAVVAARSRIVEGAVGMVRMALDQLREEGVVELDEERKAAMVSNLLVVLCGDSRVTPVVNAGTLHQ